MNEKYRILIEEARNVARNSYSPYSRFRVGAAVLSKSGKIYRGTNIENASYGLTICAERVALSAAISEGEREFEAIAVYVDSPKPSSPCGACRQFMSEFGDFKVFLVSSSGEIKETSVSELLPMGFSAEDLRNTAGD
ncbi:MAG: cytidine deaminase [Thermotogota bacterium]|nr:cytidine deaminase [Thermotogota bacterium]MDK2864752.1 cytidine deaminase [Thermotogota bacterium]HCZ07488.1 cytidine deaminase [Thermotogota bacterium]